MDFQDTHRVAHYLSYILDGKESNEMIVVDRKTRQIIAHTEIKPENMQRAQEAILLAHIRLHPELLQDKE